MKKSEFLAKLEQVLELKHGAITGKESLDAVAGWDSLAIMAFIAMVDESFGVSLSPGSIAQAKTVEDLAGLLGDKIEN